MDEISKAVVVALLRADRSRHGTDHRRFPDAAQLLDDDGSVRADVTTTRAAKCRMSAGTARLSVGARSKIRWMNGEQIHESKHRGSEQRSRTIDSALFQSD